MIGRHHVFASVFLPFYRTTEVPRRKRHKQVLGVEFATNSESPSHVEFDEIDFIVRKPEHSREHLSIEKRHFCCAPNSHVLSFGIPLCKKTAHFHGHGCVALNGKLFSSRIASLFNSCFRLPPPALIAVSTFVPLLV